MLTSLTVSAKAKHTASVLLLHGLGDSGHGWIDVAQMLSAQLPHIKFILPHAPSKPVTLNGGFRMPSWYDIKTLDKSDQNQDEEGMNESIQQLQKLVDAEKQLVPVDRIVLAGFSQGGVMALLYGLTASEKFAGVVAMSAYLPLHYKFDQLIKQKTIPILQCHGTADQVVHFDYGTESNQHLKKLGCTVDFKVYPGMGHSACNDEVRDLVGFLKRVVS